MILFVRSFDFLILEVFLNIFLHFIYFYYIIIYYISPFFNLSIQNFYPSKINKMN